MQARITSKILTFKSLKLTFKLVTCKYRHESLRFLLGYTLSYNAFPTSRIESITVLVQSDISRISEYANATRLFVMHVLVPVVPTKNLCEP